MHAVPRPPRRLTLAAAAACAAALAGCGAGSAPGSPNLHDVPLAARARIVAHAHSCDSGAHAFCARELVVVAPRRGYDSSGALLAAQTARLRHAGWSTSKGDTDYETSAESPDHRLRLTIATAADDLRSADEGRIERSVPIARALAGSMFARAPALSLLVETGSA